MRAYGVHYIYILKRVIQLKMKTMKALARRIVWFVCVNACVNGCNLKYFSNGSIFVYGVRSSEKATYMMVHWWQRQQATRRPSYRPTGDSLGLVQQRRRSRAKYIYSTIYEYILASLLQMRGHSGRHSADDSPTAGDRWWKRGFLKIRCPNGFIHSEKKAQELLYATLAQSPLARRVVDAS